MRAAGIHQDVFEEVEVEVDEVNFALNLIESLKGLAIVRRCHAEVAANQGQLRRETMMSSLEFNYAYYSILSRNDRPDVFFR